MPGSVADRVVFLESWRAAAEEAGRVHGPEIAALSPNEWRAAMASDQKYRSYGTLVFLLDKVHHDLEEEPVNARELASAILAFVDDVETPDSLYRDILRGRAWKEQANALRVTGDLRRALSAAKRSIAILVERPGLTHYRAKAELAMAQILHEMGKSDKAITIAQRCAITFRDHGDTTYYGHARMTEAWILFGRKQFRSAMGTFAALAREAEESGDMLGLARALQCTGSCARELGDIPAARDFYARSLARFEQFGKAVSTEVPRVRWSYALSLAAEDRADEAMDELEKVRSEFLRLGMNTEAATAALEVVRIRVGRGEDVIRLCSELVLTFMNAGMAQNAIETLAYLREQARSGRLSPEKLEKIGAFFRELPKKPSLVFLRPPESDG